MCVRSYEDKLRLDRNIFIYLYETKIRIQIKTSDQNKKI